MSGLGAPVLEAYSAGYDPDGYPRGSGLEPATYYYDRRDDEDDGSAEDGEE